MKKRFYSLLLFCMSGLLIAQAGTPGSAAPVYRMPAGITSADYMANTIVINVKPEFRAVCQNHAVEIPALLQVLSHLGNATIDKMFPMEVPPVKERNAYGMKMVDITLIYKIHFSAQVDLVKTINELLRTNALLFAEPKFIQHVCFTPNDPQLSSQSFINKIACYNAWNITTGDTTVVIGIVDTGTDTDHPDLAANLKHNYADPINGIDDDGDGYIDNFSGWDLGENDNDALVGTCGTCAHGSHVSGCADACTNNGVGVSGVGYNCKFMPVKIADASGALTMGYEGIQYAAAHGCQVINCSWGGSGGISLGQTIIDYATINQNSTVVVAAGNNNSNALFYPAAYNNVLAVGATNINDSKASFSNFGTYVGIMAPGANIYSTIFDNSYAYESGTSMASPIVAGCAAIVKSYFPTYNAFQVAAQLRATADDIYYLSSNAAYVGQLGTGRVNLFKALTQSGEAVKLMNPVFTDNNDDVFIVGDTIRFSGDIVNYLSATTNLVATMTSSSTNITILNSVITPGAMTTMATYSTTSAPYAFIVNAGTPQNTAIPLTVTFTDGTYTYAQSFTVTVNVDYINITLNDVKTTNTSKGRICYNDVAQVAGLGFNYLGNGTLAYETGFMIGNNSIVSDNFRGATAGGNDDDFSPVNTIQKNEPGIWSDFDTYGKFNDAIAATPLHVSVDHRSASWANAPFSKFHIFEYTIHNTGTSPLSSLYAGICSDWDVQTYSNNKADQDASLKMGYVYCTNAGGYYAAIKVLSSGAFNHYAIDNITGGGGGMDISGGFTDATKYTALSTQRPTAGGTGTGNDCIDVVSTGPYSLNANDSVVVAFALIAGESLAEIQGSAVQAQVKYDLMTAIKENDANLISTNPYPNPASNSITIPVYLRRSEVLSVELYDALGKLVQARELGTVAVGDHRIDVSLSGLPTGIYHYRLISPNGQTSGLIQKN